MMPQAFWNLEEESMASSAHIDLARNTTGFGEMAAMKKCDELKPQQRSNEVVALDTEDCSSENSLIHPYDILCGRSPECFNNVGNRRFRLTISLNLSRYVNATTRQDKSIVICSVVNTLRESGARFIKRKKKVGGSNSNEEEIVEELSERATREKVAHALRDMAVAKQQQGDQQVATSPSSSPMMIRSSPSNGRVGATPSGASSQQVVEPSFQWFTQALGAGNLQQQNQFLTEQEIQKQKLQQQLQQLQQQLQQQSAMVSPNQGNDNARLPNNNTMGLYNIAQQPPLGALAPSIPPPNTIQDFTTTQLDSTQVVQSRPSSSLKGLDNHLKLFPDNNNVSLCLQQQQQQYPQQQGLSSTNFNGQGQPRFTSLPYSSLGNNTLRKPVENSVGSLEGLDMLLSTNPVDGNIFDTT